MDSEILLPAGDLISQIPRPGDGFPDLESAQHWKPRGCGIACVRMILNAHQVTGDSYWSLVSEGVERGAYCDRGWIHQGLVDMLDRRGIVGHAERNASVNNVGNEIESGRLVIASVTVCFRGGQPKPSGEGHYLPGGHLVLVTGVRRNESGPLAFRVHHPSATEANNWADHWVAAQTMSASFSGNYLAFDQPETWVAGSDE